jgi:hypothetical protein
MEAFGANSLIFSFMNFVFSGFRRTSTICNFVYFTSESCGRDSEEVINSKNFSCPVIVPQSPQRETLRKLRGGEDRYDSEQRFFVPQSPQRETLRGVNLTIRADKRDPEGVRGVTRHFAR